MRGRAATEIHQGRDLSDLVVQQTESAWSWAYLNGGRDEFPERQKQGSGKLASSFEGWRRKRVRKQESEREEGSLLPPPRRPREDSVSGGVMAVMRQGSPLTGGAECHPKRPRICTLSHGATGYGDGTRNRDPDRNWKEQLNQD